MLLLLQGARGVRGEQVVLPELRLLFAGVQLPFVVVVVRQLRSGDGL